MVNKKCTGYYNFESTDGVYLIRLLLHAKCKGTVNYITCEKATKSHNWVCTFSLFPDIFN